MLKMYDVDKHNVKLNYKELFSKICKAECGFDTLEAFAVSNTLDRYELDMSNSFDDYYNLDSIISVIEKYQSGQVDERYLAYWASVYEHIITAGFISDDEIMGCINVKRVSLKEFMCWILSYMLDRLSFYEKDVVEYYDLDGFKTDFKLLDKLIKDNDNGLCQAVFAQHGYNDNEVIVLVINNTDKYYAKLEGYIDCNIAEFKRVEYSTLRRVSKLRKNGYRDLLNID